METSFSSSNLTSVTCSEAEITEACVSQSVELFRIHKQGYKGQLTKGINIII